MAETLLIDAYTVNSEDWVVDAEFALWTAVIPRFCPLIVGEQYAITCGGIRYEATQARDVSQKLGRQMIAFGNLSLVGLPNDGSEYGIGDDGERYLIAHIYQPIDSPPGSVTITVHQISKEPMILLKNPAGQDVSYPMPERLRVDTDDGGTVDFIREDLVFE